MTDATLKPGWTRVRFGDVVRLNTDRVADPVAAGIERYVGLEHIEPDDLRIRRWGLVADGTTFTNRFRPGQVLFGKRRAYQRKVAVADFEGVCSGDIYVFEPRDQHLLPELLPFLCQTDAFFEHAVGTSAGSLSPRTNWRQLAEHELALPPVEEQRRMVEALEAVEISLSRMAEAFQSTSVVREAFLDTAFAASGVADASALSVSPQELVRIGDVVVDTQYGLSLRSSPDGQYPIVGMTNVVGGRIVDDEVQFVDLDDADFRRYHLEAGDVLFNRTNSLELVGRTGLYDLDGDHVFASYLIRIRVDRQHLLPEYLTLFLNSPAGRRQVLAYATKGVSQANVNASNLLKVVLPLPGLREQAVFVQSVGMLRNAELGLDRRLTVTRQVRRRILTQTVGMPL